MTQLGPYIDAHVHGFLRPSDSGHFKESMTALIGRGLEKMVITALPLHDFSYELKISLAPLHIRPVLSADNIDETGLLNDWTRQYGLEETIVPFVDVRFVTDGLQSVLNASGVSGWAGIKGAYIPEADTILAIQGIPRALGISRDRYLSIQQDLFGYAQEHRLPLLYHVNLAEHFGWLCELLAAHPRLRICIPHLGYSLRKITELLERFPNAYTDPSYLIAVLKKNNPRYCAFIRQYHRRILLGSDAIIISTPVEEILSYPRYFSNCALGEAMKRRILRQNAYDFLAPPG
jgi:hypothetical protein